MTKMEICVALNDVYTFLDDVALKLLGSDPTSIELAQIQIAKRDILTIQESIIRDEKELLKNK